MRSSMGTVRSEKLAKSIRERAKRYIRARRVIQILSPILLAGIIISIIILFSIPLNLGNFTVIAIAFYVFFIVFPALVILAIIFGRFWCGWVCPVGAILDVAGLGKIRKIWCKNLCPLGAFWSLFNKISLLKLIKDEEKCVPTMCPSKNACVKECPMEADVLDEGLQDLRCIRCYNCVYACEEEAIRVGWRWSK